MEEVPSSCFNQSCQKYWQAVLEDPPKYKAPMPWIGVYVAAASLICTLAMAADLFRGFRHKKLWFPCKIFTLNAVSLTLLAVAMKLPVDLTTPMPGPTDQLAKLSSTAFMSTVIGNFMPSLGTMDNTQIFTNLIALGILVITIIANVCIQLGTGVIYNGIHSYDRVYLTSPVISTELILVVIFMLVLFVILSFTALTVPTTKKYIELKYGKIHKKNSTEQSEKIENFTGEKLKEEVKKFWMMAETGSLQFVVARYVTCSASGVICFLIALILVKAHIRLFITYPYPPLKGFGSDYKWSTILICWIQSIGVGVGTIAPTFRWFIAIKLKCPEKRDESYKTKFKTEHYWIERLIEWKESPLTLQIRGQKCKKLFHITKNLSLDFCIKVQTVIVIASKSVLLISIFFINPLLSCYQYCKMLKRKLIFETSSSNNHTRSGSDTGKNLDLSHYVLNLEGEEELPERILKNIYDATDHLIGMGNKQHQKYLIELLKKPIDFKGVAKFDSDQVPSINSAKPPNCWSLSVVTLSSIAIALPNIEDYLTNRLLHSVNEGLSYVRLVEKNLDPKGDLINIRNAAEVVWLEIELYRKWLDEDIQKKAVKGKTTKEILQRFADIAEKSVVEFKGNTNGSPEDPLNWPIKVIAANSMYRISQTLLLEFEDCNNQTEKRLFEQLSVMIADILGACLTNLPRVITMKCFCSAIEKREESVRLAARLLGETEEILKILQQCELPPLDPDQAAYIDEWRALIMQRNPLASVSSPVRTASGSSEMHIEIGCET